jgi:hypothetical protein
MSPNTGQTIYNLVLIRAVSAWYGRIRPPVFSFFVFRPFLGWIFATDTYETSNIQVYAFTITTDTYLKLKIIRTGESFVKLFVFRSFFASSGVFWYGFPRRTPKIRQIPKNRKFHQIWVLKSFRIVKFQKIPKISNRMRILGIFIKLHDPGGTKDPYLVETPI